MIAELARRLKNTTPKGGTELAQKCERRCALPSDTPWASAKQPVAVNFSTAFGGFDAF